MEPYLGELRCVGFSYAPQGWALCDGSLLPIEPNQALFELLGTQFGGDGATTFAVPDLRGRTSVGTGQLTGGSKYTLGLSGGAETVSIAPFQYPVHSHSVQSQNLPATSSSPQNKVPAAGFPVYSSAAPASAMSPQAVLPSQGEGLPHNNLQPYLTCSWIICTYGVFPSDD
jgi:microcystin-dependent protein